MTEHHFAAVPERLSNIGIVIAAIPVHRPLSATDPTEWIVMCDRGEECGERRYSTNRLRRLGEDYLATGGDYDFTYDEAFASLMERAGTVTPARLKRAVEKADHWIGNLTANAEHQRNTDSSAATVRATMTRATDLADIRNILTGADW